MIPTATLLPVDLRAVAEHSGGVTFLDSREVTGELTYADLALRARGATGALRDRELRPGARVLLPLPTGPEYLIALLGCLAGGFVPCTVPPPIRPEDPGSTGMRQFRAALEAVVPDAVVMAGPPPAGLSGGGPPFLDTTDLAHPPVPEDSLPAAGPDTLHHIQLTSGSTSAPRAAVLTHGQVAASLSANLGALEPLTPHERILHWLPLHHDMGFVLTLTALHAGLPLDLMPSIAFLRDPLSWLRHISRRGATVTAAPPFGYRAAAERSRRAPVAGLDLSSLRQAYVGAEPIPFSVLSAFQEEFAGRGLAEDVLIPCYGMAETVLASTMSLGTTPSGELGWGRVRAVRLDREALRENRAVEARERAPALTSVACGRPVSGLSVEIRTPEGRLCAEGEVGEIVLSGDSVMAGYLGPGGRPVPVPGGRHASGDLGFLRNGELHVVGRVKEMLVVRGKNLPPYDVEAAVESHPDVAAGAAAVFSCTDDDGEYVVAVVESRHGPAGSGTLREEIAALVRGAFGFTPREVVVVRRGRIPRTTSGKRQRAGLRDAYLRGELL
ncbi:AMP-binding protein [Streptomyces sodiiphilus]|uniref:AMP-binding protein n=1 Tax=Streptomyces sodiiphilus TaxID=226217 RepID=A0ABN2PUI6_9ACTN